MYILSLYFQSRRVVVLLLLFLVACFSFFVECVCVFVLRFCGKTDETTGEVVVAAGDWGQYGVRIASRNTFPTAAGLASSAAGLACLSECYRIISSSRRGVELLVCALIRCVVSITTIVARVVYVFFSFFSRADEM